MAGVLASMAGLFSLATPALPAPGGPALPAGTVAGALLPAALPVTHGDLLVLTGEVYTIQPNAGGNTYYQGGNITVEAGGTLIVKNTVLEFVQYVANSGTAMARLSHIYHFADAGTVEFTNSTVTTDVQVLNAYAKLNLTVTGILTAWNTTFAFPGWFAVSGGGAEATLNASVVSANPAVAGLGGKEPSAIYGDTLYAPTVSVTAGAVLNLFGSQVLDTYADNVLASGAPNPTPLAATGGSLAPLGTLNATVHGPSDSANLTLDWSYPSAGAQSGSVTLNYTNTGSTPATASVSVWYALSSYSLGSVTLRNGTNNGTIRLPFSPALLAAISARGMLNYLNYTGDFGVTPGEIAVQLTNTAGLATSINSVAFQLNTTGRIYDVGVAGPGSRLSAADATLDLNWAPAPTSPYALTSPYPWTSNKLVFSGGALGYLANVSTSNAIPGVFSTSAVLPDASSQVYFYRMAEFNFTGASGLVAVAGAHVTPYYAYNANQSNNATANALNNLAVADPAIWGYVDYWDTLHGVTSYATSNVDGQAFVFLAAGNLTGPTLPDGLFLGGYHIGVSVPAVGIATQWFNWSVSPYPTGVASGTPGYQSPDYAPPQTFAGYYGSVSFAPQVTANGTLDPNATVRIGQDLGFRVTATDAGTATVTNVSGWLYYDAAGTTLLSTFTATGLHLSAPGQTLQFNLTWLVTDAVTGLHHGTFTQPFYLVFQWNEGNASRAGGTVFATANVSIAPSQIRVVSATTTATTTLDVNQQYYTSGVIQYNGTQRALVELYAVPTSGGSPIEIGYADVLSGVTFNMSWSGPLSTYLTPGSYTLEVTASYDGVNSAAYVLPGTYTVPSPTAPTTSFFLQKFLGLPFWAWLAIAAAIVVGLVAFLLFARRSAAGKLVECGECGNLIPEDATVCPKCGAEFEVDLIRCSRCASTIPANSKYCPECAAQLLGKAGEAGEEAERQSYADFTEKFRAEAKRELGENYSEGAFWDWWKRQPTYTSYGQWKLQQGQGTPRTGMTAPPPGSAPEAAPPKTPPRGGAAATAPPAARAAPAAAPPPATEANLKACPNCAKEIPPEYLVCPFCGAVTQ